MKQDKVPKHWRSHEGLGGFKQLPSLYLQQAWICHSIVRPWPSLDSFTIWLALPTWNQSRRRDKINCGNVLFQVQKRERGCLGNSKQHIELISVTVERRLSDRQRSNRQSVMLVRSILEIRVRNKPSPTLPIYPSRRSNVDNFSKFSKRQSALTVTGRGNAMKEKQHLATNINNPNWTLYYI